jgi:hypothetical protein
MPTRVIKVRYNADETGPAELISRRVARIIDAPLLGEVCRDTIVRLDRDPRTDEGVPEIQEVLYSPFCCQSWVQFREAGEAITLAHVLRALGADCHAALPPHDDEPGHLVVWHHDCLNPQLLAEAIGIPQPQEEGMDDGEEAGG